MRAEEDEDSRRIGVRSQCGQKNEFKLHGSGDPVQIFFLFSQVAQTGMVIECVSRKKAHEFGYCQMEIRPPSYEINQVRTGYLPPRSWSKQTSRIFPDIPSCTSLKMQIAAAYTQSLLSSSP